MLTSSKVRSILPASMRDRSRMSLIRPNRCCPELKMAVPVSLYQVLEREMRAKAIEFVSFDTLYSDLSDDEKIIYHRIQKQLNPKSPGIPACEQ